MKLKLSMARLLGAAMFLVAFCAAPSIANAHADHSFPMAATAVSAPTIVIQVIDEVRVSVAQETRSESSGKVCGGILCCGNAPCVACVFVIVSEISIFVPLSASSLLRSPMIAPGSGIDRVGISRPPRSIV